MSMPESSKFLCDARFSLLLRIDYGVNVLQNKIKYQKYFSCITEYYALQLTFSKPADMLTDYDGILIYSYGFDSLRGLEI